MKIKIPENKVPGCSPLYRGNRQTGRRDQITESQNGTNREKRECTNLLIIIKRIQALCAQKIFRDKTGVAKIVPFLALFRNGKPTQEVQCLMHPLTPIEASLVRIYV